MRKRVNLFNTKREFDFIEYNNIDDILIHYNELKKEKNKPLNQEQKCQ